ncbi:MAG TPA: hypothetical protein VMT57_07950 [Candidatus Thermoplasmatota archaeon]|nr:hypothetical protein [Candidatus Thermoplasmatota archaeon]
MKNSVKLICTLVMATLMVFPISVLAKHPQPVSTVTQSKVTYNPQIKHLIYTPLTKTDFDPLDSSINVTVAINEIRALKTINLFSDPNFFVKVTINNMTFTSPVWSNTKYVERPNWSATAEVPKDEEFVNVTIELWSKSKIGDILCDLCSDYGTIRQCYTAELTYSIATGIWWGDDYLGDPSGYGRLSGIDDNSIYEQDRDCELWFAITQTDYDHDGLPYWLETTMYNTSPLVDNRGLDPNQDGIPIEWDHTFGLYYIEWGHDQGYYMEYNPNVWQNQTALDPDLDGLNNIEEYKTWQWGSDPFRQDIFIEIDQMGPGPKGQGGDHAPLASFDLLRDSYARHNIVWHIDDGRLGGGEQVPFDDNLSQSDLSNYYWDYFMHGDAHNWRRGVFRWCLVGYNGAYAFHGTLVNGFTFSSNINHSRALDCFYVSGKNLDSKATENPLLGILTRKTINRDKQTALVWAGAIMHETGHTLNVQAPGCDDQNSAYPWQVDFWRYAPYKSVMNYRYIYTDLVDYSDGSRGKNDYDDWGTIDLTFFNPGNWG